MNLTFENVKKGEFDLVYKIPQEVGARYEALISFDRGRDFNSEIKNYMTDFVKRFYKYLTPNNQNDMDKRLVQYNKLVVDLKTVIMQSVKTPSILISGGGNYPVRRKEKELERTHALEAELYSDYGKHAKFMENTHKMFDPILIEQREKVEKMRKERAAEKGWRGFYKEVDHDEIKGYGIDLDYNRVYIMTHGKPSEAVRNQLKKAALKWSPKNQRWQRVLTDNAIYSLCVNVFDPLGLSVTKNDFTN